MYLPYQHLFMTLPHTFGNLTMNVDSVNAYIGPSFHILLLDDFFGIRHNCVF